MFDEFDEIMYIPEAMYTEKEIDKKLERLKKDRRKFRLRKGLYSACTIGILGVFGLGPAIISTTVGIAEGHSPFKRDDVVKKAIVKTEFNSDGVVKTSKYYIPYGNEKSVLKYYSDWIRSGDKYVSCETTYDVKGLSYDEIDGLIRIKGFDNVSFGEPISEKIISKEDVSREELERGSHYEGFIYKTDDNDYTIVPQSNNENIDDIVNYLVIPGIAGVIPGGIAGFVWLYTGGQKLVDASWDLRETKDEIKLFEEKKKKLVKKL